MWRAAFVDDLHVGGLVGAVQHVAASMAIEIAIAEHELALLVQMVEHHAGGRVLIGERSRTRTGLGIGVSVGESEQRSDEAGPDGQCAARRG